MTDLVILQIPGSRTKGLLIRLIGSKPKRDEKDLFLLIADKIFNSH